MISHELILGGQRSGKSRLAESRAAAWLARAPHNRATLLATALAVGVDDEMTLRIAAHQAGRAARLPALECVEVPRDLADAVGRLSDPTRLLIIDCLTLCLTNWLMPPAAGRALLADGAADGADAASDGANKQLRALKRALSFAAGPVVIVGNEIGLGVIPMGRETRAFVDTLGLWNQSIAAVCDRVTLMVAGIPMTIKGNAV